MVRLIWLIGVPGAGKSTVRRELVQSSPAELAGTPLVPHRTRPSGGLRRAADRQRRARRSVEPDTETILVGVVGDPTPTPEHDVVFLAGSVPNELDVWDLFDLVLCLVVDDETLRRRLESESRTDNDFGAPPNLTTSQMGPIGRLRTPAPGVGGRTAGSRRRTTTVGAVRSPPHPSSSPKLPISQAFNAIGREEAVAVEQLVDLPSAVALLPPEWPQYRPGAGGSDGVGEILRTRGIEGDGRNVTRCDGTGQPGDVHHVDDLDRRREDALKLGDA